MVKLGQAVMRFNVMRRFKVVEMDKVLEVVLVFWKQVVRTRIYFILC